MRVGWRREEEVHGEENKVRGREGLFVAFERVLQRAFLPRCFWC